MSDVIVVIGPGQIGQAIARRVGVGKHVLLADLRQDNAEAAAEVLANAGYEVSVATVDASSRAAVHALVETGTRLGEVTGLIHAAGVSPSQASPSTILKVDLYGTARAGGVRQRDRLGWAGRRDRVAVRAPPSAAHRRAERGVGHHARGGAARPSFPSPRPSDGLASRLPAREARQLAARDGRGGWLGQARRAGQHDQPRHHHHPTGQGRARCYSARSASARRDQNAPASGCLPGARAWARSPAW
jgi:short chain dehydrogenase